MLQLKRKLSLCLSEKKHGSGDERNHCPMRKSSVAETAGVVNCIKTERETEVFMSGDL